MKRHTQDLSTTVLYLHTARNKYSLRWCVHTSFLTNKFVHQKNKFVSTTDKIQPSYYYGEILFVLGSISFVLRSILFVLRSILFVLRSNFLVLRTFLFVLWTTLLVPYDGSVVEEWRRLPIVALQGFRKLQRAIGNGTLKKFRTWAQKMYKILRTGE